MAIPQGITKILPPSYVPQMSESQTDYPRRTVSRIFEEEVEKNAGCTAVVCGEERLSYAQLNHRANQFAHYLISQGTAPGTRIALCMTPSINMITVLLGIIKAQCVYVPIYHETPASRTQYYLEDAAIPLVITDSSTLSRLTQAMPAQIFCYDTRRHLLNDLCAENPRESGSCQDPLYVIYTSGSTGAPKGVVVPHRGIARLVRNTNYLYVTPADCVAQTLNIAFDASGLEIWGALLNGASSCIVPREVMLQSESLGELLRRQRVTIMFITTALFHELAVTSPGTLGSLEYIYIGGEAMNGPTVRKFFDHYRGHRRPRVFNAYGPTECSVMATCFEVTDDADFSAPIPIGKPISNTDCHVLDGQLSPCVVGVPGELYLGGDGVALGYLNRTELSAEKFIFNPFDGGRTKLYRTGDVVKYLPDGNLLFLDRIDNQVKVRGFRIELGEIEACLMRHPEVRQAVVLVTGTEKRLCAYLVPRRPLTIADLRSFLAKELPSYMIPNGFALLPKLPLTANGKVDKAALGRVPLSEREYAEPVTEEERELARIWAEILPLAGPFGREDNFFEVGGNSLSAMRLAAKIKAAFARRIEIGTIFRRPRLKELSAEVQSGCPAIAPIAHSEERDIPLSYPQEMIWLHQLTAPDAPIYNEILTLTIEDRLKVKALERSLQEIVRRHEMLRVRVTIQDGRPFQTAVPYEPFSVPCIDFCHVPERERLREVELLVKAEARKPFVFACAPLIQFLLVRLRPECYKLYVIFHHVLLDGISMGTIFPAELYRYYAQFLSGSPLPPGGGGSGWGGDLLPGSIQYTDFALWQRRNLTEEVLAQHGEYWRQKLSGLSPLRLPVFPGALSGAALVGSHKRVALSRALSDRVKEFSREQGVTLFMTLLAAFKVLLYRYTGQKDIAVGTVVSLRDREEWQNLLGNFLNTVVVRTNFSEEPNFRDFLAMVRDTCLEAYEHQEMPFHKLSRLFPRGRPHPAQILFVLQPENTLPPGWHISESELQLDTAKFHLSFSLEDGKDGIVGFMEYDTGILDSDTVGRICEHFPVLLSGIVEDCRRPIGRLPLLTEAEVKRQVVEWNDTGIDHGPIGPLREILECQARHTPDRIAVRCGNEQLTYRELDQKSDRLASYLGELGVETDTVVAISMERCLWYIIAIAAVFKAGGCYVPIDPAHPESRRRFMLEDSRARVLLVHGETRDKFHFYLGSLVPVDEVWPNISARCGEKVPPRVGIEGLAYLIYTSGSTGTPKGVMIDHGSITERVRSSQACVPLTASDISMHISSFNFDASVMNLWWPLVAGATVVLADSVEIMDLRQCAALIKKHRVTHFDTTPSVCAHILEYLDPSCMQHLTCVTVGGEALPRELLSKIRALGVRIYNIYGPTECTVQATAWLDNGLDHTPLIGRPLPNARCYILDGHCQPVPVGVAGELYLGGSGVARGYLNRPELTQERFVADPFATGGRMYRTGDLARYHSDGNIEFLGRSDDQVKLHGYRIELGEIESALLGYPGIREAKVIVRNDPPSHEQLVAYIVADSSDSRALYQYLTGRLPRYMIPNAFVALAHMPVTLNGKLDVRALPAPGNEHRLGSGKKYAGPESPLHELLCHIMAEALKIPQVGIDDDFFELGGHSLLVMQVIRKVNKAGLKMEVVDIFHGRTVRKLSTVIGTRYVHPNQSTSPTMVELQRGDSPPLFVLHGPTGDLLGYVPFLEHLDPAQPVYGFQSLGLSDIKRAHTTIEEMAAYYVRELVEFYPAGPIMLAGWCLGGTIAFEMAQQLRESGREVALLALSDCWACEPVKKTSRFYLAQIRYLLTIPLSKWLQCAVNKIRHMFRTEEDVDIFAEGGLLAQCAPIRDLNLRALEAYRSRPYPGKIVLLCARDNNPMLFPPTFGWQFVSSDLSIIHVPGAHETMFKEPHVAVLADRITAAMEAVVAQ